MPLFCVTCKAVFENCESHRSHYRTEWHKYNLKRKISELPTVTFQEYKEREAKYRQDTEPNSEKILTCKPCHKNFNSENALQSHLKSKKHAEICSKESALTEERKNVRNESVGEVNHLLTEQVNQRNDHSIELLQSVSDDEIVVEDDDDDDWESVDDEDIPLVPTNMCLFCNYGSSDTEENMQHMQTLHSFYIPDKEYLIDQEGLLCYLGQKITYGFTCLKCNHQKRSLHAVQQHMIAKGHCSMNFESSAVEEYEDYYDYTSSYHDHQGSVADEEVVIDVLQPDGYELTLPSGSTVGHRSLAVYYRQNLKPVKDTSRKTGKFTSTYRAAICQGGNIGTLSFYKSKEFKYILQKQRRYYLKLGLKQNKFQPHFRPQVMC